MTNIPFIDLKSQYASLKQSIDARIQAVLDHGQYIMGPEVQEMERRLAEFVGAPHCISVASGTEALLIALMAAGVGPGDEVITTPFSFAATAEVIALVGATPVFADIDAETYNLDPCLVAAAITDRTRAIMPVSLFGQPADMDEINALATQHKVIVIEDAAQSFGASYKDKRSTGLSRVGCTSFFPSKPLGCYGDGGAIFTDDDALAKIMREIRVHGQERRYFHTRVGVGGRMDTIQCAVILAKLDNFERELQQRRKIGEQYLQLLAGANGIASPLVRKDRTSVWAQFTVQVDQREDVIKALADAGVPTAVHYPMPLHLQPAYKDMCRISGSLTNAEVIAGKVLSLPMHPYLQSDDVAKIVSALRAALV